MVSDQFELRWKKKIKKEIMDSDQLELSWKKKIEKRKDRWCMNDREAKRNNPYLHWGLQEHVICTGVEDERPPTIQTAFPLYIKFFIYNTSKVNNDSSQGTRLIACKDTQRITAHH